MENRTEIGKKIKDKLADLDKNPSEFVWSKIETDLNKKRNKRILSWIIPGVIIAVLFCTLFYFNSDFQDKTQKSDNQAKQETTAKAPSQKTNLVSDQKQNQKSNPKLQKSGSDIVTRVKKTKSVKLIKESSKLVTSTNEYEEYEVVKKYKVILKKEQVTTKLIKSGTLKKTIQPKATENKLLIKKNKTTETKSKKKTKTHSTKHSKKVVYKPLATEIPKNKSPEKDAATQKTVSTPRVIEAKIDTIAKMDSLKLKKDTTPKREYKKTVYNTENKESDPELSVSVFYGPAISGSLNSASMIDPSMDNLATKHPVTSHYGVYVKTMYDKIGFRAGFSKINLKTSTRLDKDELIPNYNNIELKSEINIKQTFTGSNEVDLVQKLSYYELPIEFVYAFKKDESKIGMEAFTGFSFLISDKNQLSLKSEKVAMQNIGEAKNISGINFSYNLGIGISYKLNAKFSLDINPLFKYYLSTFKESGDAKPHSFSLQSGVSYKF
ncbi:hypothetical protein D0809_02490 [Flavobacterium circumlabens]|uniref:Uncharacterized protein n=1 Tax=Flavobacterium circumlabens TaxID=2133765 RepID=A0A4Y7UHF8_9FLAO|nr:outer membrane beta-barrel protein [Flavobacterium circumlabens]TCN60750.1 hypothetical protein EV142_101325 [Flavobacterium circumlabens]TEB45893.1 hypothetical protein D0809_02490 [Flavobacterium circumlabens]